MRIVALRPGPLAIAFGFAMGCALVSLGSRMARAQGAGGGTGTSPTTSQPPASAAKAAADAPAANDTASPADERPKSTGSVGGVSFSDKPSRRASLPRAALRRAGPTATFPGFEQLPDGGSRLLVQLSSLVPVEERRAAGSVTYVLRGAHLRVNNDANALVTVHFNTPVYRAALKAQGADLLFLLELRSAVSPTFKVVDHEDKTATLQVDFPKGAFLPGDGSETFPQQARDKPRSALGRSTKASPRTDGTPRSARPVDSTRPASGELGPRP